MYKSKLVFENRTALIIVYTFKAVTYKIGGHVKLFFTSHEILKWQLHNFEWWWSLFVPLNSMT